ncbi:hypothetical protein R84B8_01288 [Treponema sp. R8-4-B8]
MIYKLSDICTITKGDIGIMKAVPGEYAMITLGEENKSHNEYQFDAKAVIVPLVSSTGHGHASMKRVKYFEGKFALGNILCAVIPKDEKKVNAKYLHIFLHENRENLLVSLMKGAANVSLPIKRLDNVEVEIPSMKRQIEIIELEKIISINNEKLVNKFENQIKLLSYLRQSILQEAIQGKLTAEWREQNTNIEPATELLKRIKAEKEQLIKEKKIKKEKPLSTISKNEIPFELPQGWVWCRLGDIAQSLNGLTYKPTDVVEIGIPVLRSNNIQDNKLLLNNLVKVKSEVPSLKMAMKNDILICVANGSKKLIGKVALIDVDDLSFGSFMRVIRTDINHNYLFNFLLSEIFRKQLNDVKSTGINQITKDVLSNIIVVLPSLPEQQIIVSKLEALLEKCNQLQDKIENMKKHSKELLRALFNETFEKAN